MLPTDRANPLHKKDSDNRIIRQLSARESGKSMRADVPFLFFTEKYNLIVSSDSCIGQRDSSFTAHILTMSNIYTTLPGMKYDLQTDIDVETFAMQETEAVIDYSTTNFQEWRKVFLKLSTEERQELKERLVSKYKINLIHSLPGEDMYGYLLRNAQRLPQSKKKDLLHSNLKVKLFQFPKTRRKYMTRKSRGRPHQGRVLLQRNLKRMAFTLSTERLRMLDNQIARMNLPVLALILTRTQL